MWDVLLREKTSTVTEYITCFYHLFLNIIYYTYVILLQLNILNGHLLILKYLKKTVIGADFQNIVGIDLVRTNLINNLYRSYKYSRILSQVVETKVVIKLGIKIVARFLICQIILSQILTNVMEVQCDTCDTNDLAIGFKTKNLRLTP